MTQEYFVGQGSVYAIPRDANGVSGGAVWVGDCDKFELTFTQKFDDIFDSFSGKRMQAAHIPIETTSAINMNLLSWDVANLVRVVNGSTAGSVVAGTVTGESINAYNGTVGFTKRQNISTLVLTAGATPLVLNTDYTVDLVTGAISFLAASTVVPAGAAVVVTAGYAFAAYAGRVEGLMTSPKSYGFVFTGINMGDGSQVRVEVFKATVSLPKNLAFLEAKHAALTLEGAMLQDTSRPTGTSQFFAIEKQV